MSTSNDTMMLKTPFHSRIEKLNELNAWEDWMGYTTPSAYYDVELEYFAVRNSTGVYDISPMTKYRITGPESRLYIDRLVTRDMINKVGPGRVAYAGCCNDQGQVIDDGTIFHLSEGEYRLCSQERHLPWLRASAIGFDVNIREETSEIAALAVQGPTSYSVIRNLGG